MTTLALEVLETASSWQKEASTLLAESPGSLQTVEAPPPGATWISGQKVRMFHSWKRGLPVAYTSAGVEVRSSDQSPAHLSSGRFFASAEAGLAGSECSCCALRIAVSEANKRSGGFVPQKACACSST